MKYFIPRKPSLKKVKRWLNGSLVSFPVSYTYNGLIEVNGKLYNGFKVSSPTVPKGHKLVSIGIGLNLNTRPPIATMYLKPTK